MFQNCDAISYYRLLHISRTVQIKHIVTMDDEQEILNGRSWRVMLATEIY